MGIILGWGPCMTFCTPLISPYIMATQSGWLRGLKSVIVFSLSRIISYIILALIVSALGQLVISKFYESKAGENIFLIIGLFIIFLGIILLWGKLPNLRFYQKLCKYTTPQSLKSLAILGLLIGFSPCLPLLGILSYIAFVSKNLLYGAFLGLCFGLGTLLSPLIPLGILSGSLPKLIFRREKFLNIFNRICGLFLIYLGFQLVIKVLKT